MTNMIVIGLFQGMQKYIMMLVLYFVGYSGKGVLEPLISVLLKSLVAWLGRPDFSFVSFIKPKYQDPIFSFFIKKNK